jgi:hypothetical protein
MEKRKDNRSWDDSTKESNEKHNANDKTNGRRDDIATKNNRVKVIYSKRGIANFYGDYIEINENLRKHKKLRDYIVKHELGHSEKFDLWHEFKSMDLKMMPSLISFIIKNPSTWNDIFPIQYNQGHIIYDVNLLILYLTKFCLIAILALIFYALIK